VDIALNLVTIIVSIVLTAVILLQTKGSSFSGAFGSGSDSIQRTRRGFERTLFQFTIMIAVFFVILCIMSSIVLSN
jgi:preprotein translocase subunit SecG